MIEVSKDLNEMFQEIRTRKVNEDFDVGQAAQALFELKKAASEYNEFISGTFNQTFRELHKGRDNRTDKIREASEALSKATKALESVSDEVMNYLYSLDTYDNPDSDFDGKHRTGRWKRWEHKPTRAEQKRWEEEDGI